MKTCLRTAADHLRKNNMTYLEHLLFAAGHGTRCIRAAALLAVHAVFPCWFQRAGSKLVKRMSKDFVEHRKSRRQVT